MDVTLENNSRVRSDECFGEVTQSCQNPVIYLLYFLLFFLYLYTYLLDVTMLKINHEFYQGSDLSQATTN